MVRKSSEESCQEVEENWATGRAGKSDYDPECKHEVHHHTEVCAQSWPRFNLPSGLREASLQLSQCYL